MINYLLSLVYERRTETLPTTDERRRVTAKQARCMLKEASDEFTEAVKRNPRRIRDFLRRLEK